MRANPILEEVWRIKDELAAEAGHDVHRLCENTRRWAAEHALAGQMVGNGEELRRMAFAHGDERPERAALALREAPQVSRPEAGSSVDAAP